MQKKKRKYSTYVKLWSLLQSIPLLCWMLGSVDFYCKENLCLLQSFISSPFLKVLFFVTLIFWQVPLHLAETIQNTAKSFNDINQIALERVCILSPLSLRQFPHFVLWIWSFSSKRETSVWVRLPKEKNNFFAFWKLWHVSISLCKILQHHLCN